MSICVVERGPQETGTGDELNQVISGFIGVSLTTLPAFIVMPLWAAFMTKYRITDGNGQDDNVVCMAICFLTGMALWAVVFVLFII
ncbi:hypothetical protein [Shinella sp. BYT-45]|uniref:hypothetical protein n=1 Tax=Shinella sp. BYT-45 TaxID=3377377 RepID=UPI0039803B1B